MSFFRHSSISLITVVVFLALAAIASYLYSSGDPGEKVELDDSRLWRQLQSGWGTISGADRDAKSGFFVGDDYSSIDEGFWLRTKARLQEEWEKSGQETSAGNFTWQDEEMSAEFKELASEFKRFSWQPDDSGGQIIFKAASGKEYKLNFPYKFWRP